MPDHPSFRAVVRRGEVRLVDWSPFLPTRGPSAQVLRRGTRPGVTIVDLSVLREDGDEEESLVGEVVVTLIAGDLEEASEPLRRWAAAVGYRRLWLPGELVAPGNDAGGAASTTCPSCRSRWDDGDPSFWLMVRRRGCFPMSCPLCGGDIPQWTVDPGSVSPSARRPATSRSESLR